MHNSNQIINNHKKEETDCSRSGLRVIINAKTGGMNSVFVQWTDRIRFGCQVYNRMER